MPPLGDAAVRAAIAGDLETTLLVEAAAGTGKTTALVSRIVAVLASGRAVVTGIAAVTFTEKAAGELKLRLREDLEVARAVASVAERGRIETALESLEEAHVSTIHGFCAELLREEPVAAGLDPLFTVLTEPQARALFDEAFAAWFQDVLRDPPEGVRRSLRRSSRPNGQGDPDDDGPVERLARAGWDLAEWRDFPARWQRPVFDREAGVASLRARLDAFAALSGQPASTRDVLFADTRPARAAAADMVGLVESGDLDGAEALVTDLRRNRDFRRARKGYGSAFAPGVSRAEVQAAHQDLVDALDGFARDADADLAALLRDDLVACVAGYERLKGRAGSLDFLDLLLRTRNLLRDRDDVRQRFQARFSHLFVDEFQDTDPLQAEILLLLAAADPTVHDAAAVVPVPGKLFVVGDPKQSIYRFRRADVGTYETVCRQLREAGARPVVLSTSFRSVPHLQRFVNAAFSRSMTGDATLRQAAYVELGPHRGQPPAQPSVIALPVPEPYGVRHISGAAIERSLPDAVGAFVHWLLRESGWTVTERRSGDTRVPIEARHVCVLFRRFVSWGRDVTRPYVDALEARGVGHLLVGGRAFHQREEIETLRAALAAVEWPDDELSVFATLRGALFAIGDEELLEYRFLEGTSGFHPFRVPAQLPDHLEPIGEALRLLAALHLARNRRPVAETLGRLLDHTRAHVGFAIRRSGEQVLANVLHVAELARQYERGGGISFRGFVDELRGAAEHAQATEAPIVEEGSDGVRLMTVHKAKGLEFPVVVLADLTAKLAAAEASRYLDADRGLSALRIGGWSPVDLTAHQALEQARDAQEGIRIAYVAATRARDLLVVPAVGDQPYEGWLSPLNPVLYPPSPARRTPLPAVACPAFRSDSVLHRPDDATALAQTVAPGRHEVTDAGGEPFDIVWWDPAALALGAEPPFGLRRQDLIARDVPDGLVEEGVRRYEAWRNARARALADGRRPSAVIRTVTDAALAPVAGRRDPPVDVVSLHPPGALPVPGGRPAGPRFGSLVHAVLGTVALGADAGEVAVSADTWGRVVGATSEEVRAAADVVTAALAHPLLQRARLAQGHGWCVREMPVTLTDGGTLIEGVLDLAFEHEGRITVVDFKTDRPEAEVIERYRRQVLLYARAVAQVKGLPVDAVLLQV